MTREEADFIGAMNMCDEISNEAYKKIMCHCGEPEPCEDAVSRKAVDELSRNLVHVTRDKADFLCNFWEGLQKLPSVTPTPKWIPCSERLPELDEYGYSTYVLVSFSNYTLPCIGQLRKTDGEDHWYEGDDEKALDSFDLHVNAWMPLPEPYKAESEVQEW